MSKYAGAILIVEDDIDVMYTAKLVLQQKFTNVLSEPDPKRLIKVLETNAIDVVLLDMNFSKGQTSGNEGLFWLREILKASPDVSVIMHTAYGEISLAVEAMKIGAVDFLVKPWEQEKLLATVVNVYKLAQSQKEVAKLKMREVLLEKEIAGAHPDMIGQSVAMQQVRALIDKVARTDANVLILGENGTGKELVARELHRKSPRNKQPLIKVDVGALTESLFESEMFGHKRGAFTDARDDRKGRFEVASGGTIFLDEIGNLSPSMQSKLLTVLQARQVTPVGTNFPIDIDIRLICATNADLHGMAERHTFRQDLLYRINTVEIELPPLRQRTDDIPVLADFFMQQFCNKYQKQPIAMQASAMRKLQQYPWPGNIRELQHCMERAVILSSGGSLSADDFQLDKKPNLAPVADSLHKDDMERQLIIKALHESSGNLSKVSQLVGMGRTTLYRKMKKYGL